MIVAIYARFSSVADLEKTSSIEAQIQMCQQKAIENGWVVDQNSKMEYNEHSYLEKTHLDFMVCENKMPYRFLFAIEYDGIGNGYTTSDKNRDWKLNLKKRISEQEGCPLLVIRQSDLPNLDDMIKEQIFTTYWKNTLPQQEMSIVS